MLTSTLFFNFSPGGISKDVKVNIFPSARLLFVQVPGAGARPGQHASLCRHGLPPLQLPRHGGQHTRGQPANTVHGWICY